MKYRYCTSAVASVALTAGKLGWGTLHGHDVLVRVCVDSPTVVDIEVLRSVTIAAVREFDHASLDERIGPGALIEDMLAVIRERITGALRDRGVEACVSLVEASIPSGSIILLPEGGNC